MAYFVTEYTIHFDDTMAYGSHHFLTAFKWQCASREAFLFGERIFDMPGVKQALEQVHLLTVEAYARNLSPAKLGDRLAILLSLEQWGQASARFCYRVFGQQGQAVSAGYQTLVCADAHTQLPISLPVALQQAMEAMREIEEPWGKESFRDRVLAGGSKLEELLGDPQREVARQFLTPRYPSPHIVRVPASGAVPVTATDAAPRATTDVAPSAAVAAEAEVWLFGGQATFDARLFSQRLIAYAASGPAASEEIERSRQVVASLLDAHSLDLFFSGSEAQCQAAVKASAALSQVAIHWQNVLGAKLWTAQGHSPQLLLGHSFGETAALGVAGCFDLEIGTRAVCARIRAVADLAPADGGLLVVSADVSRVETEVRQLGLHELVLAGRNHPDQLVMSGPRTQLQILQKRLQTSRIAAMMIDSPAAFHHPSLQAAAASWLKALRELPLQPPRVAVYSPIHHRLITASDDVAVVLAEQLTKPFDLQAAIAQTLRTGVTRFVDCGSAGALARLVSKAGVDELRLHCLGHMPPMTGPGAAGQSTPPASAISQVSRVAIVGTGCILPAGVTSPAELFTAIAESRLGIVDQQLFDPHWAEDFYSPQLQPDRSNSPLFGRVLDSGITVPDGVDPRLFESFTRTQKLLCIALAPCLDSLRGARRIVCLVGSTADGFEDQDEVAALRLADIDPQDPEVDRRMHTARSAGHTPHAAVQQVFDLLIRPNLQVILVDAACASSLYTLTLGMQMLESNRADAVIAGGFFCPGPGNSCLFSQFRGMTSTGCRPFDAHADGVVFSEGAALVTLRRMTDVAQHGLTVEAIVAGSGLSSDGRSPSANVPQTRGQLLAVERCYANYDIDPGSITAIEGHGTSTPVGDATEVETLRRFFAGRTSRPIPVHSLKGLLGHAGWAAGTASVIAVCEYMRHGLFPAQAMYRQPSTALLEAAGTLTVATAPIALTSPNERIAIDGFGFGGANAHVVLEKYSPDLAPKQVFRSIRSAMPAPAPADSAASWTPSNAAHEPAAGSEDTAEFVVVAQHIAWPSNSLVFDRSQIQVPAQHVILPQLADDMDVSQALAVRVTGEVLDQVPQLDSALRREVGLVLAMSGKTQRGVEATLRILAPRLRRVLASDASLQQRIDKAYRTARPSGPYTLQCMMPNVAAGRAALLLNLNGPNFVVDSGEKSLEAAFASATSLLSGGARAGTKLVVVAAIAAQGDTQPNSAAESGESEVAAAFLVTTRRWAKEFSLPVMCSLDALFGSTDPEPSWLGGHQLPPQLSQQVQAIQRAQAKHLGNCCVQLSPSSAPSPVDADRRNCRPCAQCSAKASDQQLPATRLAPEALQLPSATDPTGTLPQRSPPKGACQLYAPVWVEKPAGQTLGTPGQRRLRHLLVIVRADFSRHAELASALAEVAEELTVVVIGEAASRVVSENDKAGDKANWVAIEDTDVASLSAAVDELSSHAQGLDAVSVVDEAKSWELLPTLTVAAHDNSLCELLFMIAQHRAEQLRAGGLELWGLFVDAWNGQLHPISGPTAGLLKSIQREFSAARTGTVCTQELSISAAVRSLWAESAAGDREPEIVYTPARRLVRRLQPATAQPIASSASQKVPQVELNARSIVVAAGGAKGVTAVMLDALLSDYQCTAIAIGRSPLEAGPEEIDSPEVEQDYYARFMREHPQASAAEMKRSFEAARGRWEAHQTIQRLRSHGGRVEYLVADVTDAAQMATIVQQIAVEHGQIDLLLYGAGIQKSKRLEDRSLADFRSVYAAKVTGLHNLVQACSAQLGRSVPTHVLTSAYSLFGNDGQHDYGAANETLDRLCGLTQQADLRPAWTSIAWLAWDAIGMTRGSEYRALAKKRRLSGVAPVEGQELFRQVLGGQSRSAINVPLSAAEHVEYGVRTVPHASPQFAGRTLELNVPLTDMACLPFHQVRNVPTLPGAWIVDAFVGVARSLVDDMRGDMQAVIQDLSFAKFVRTAHGQEPNVRVIAQQSGHAIAVWMLADIVHPSGVVLARDQICASATIVFERSTVVAALTIPAGHDAAAPRTIVHDPYCQQRGVIQLSGLFDCLSEIELYDQVRRAKFEATHPPASYHHIPALLLDAAWRVGAMHTPSRGEELFVPVRVGRITLPLDLLPHASSLASPATWEIRSTAPRAGSKEVRWDRTEVYNPAGHLKVVIEDAWATSLA